MKFKTFILSGTLAMTAVFISSCGSDLPVDPAGACITCMTAATTSSPSVTVEACADGAGNLTITENGVATVTDAFNLDDFQITQEASGSSCQ